MHSDLGLEKYSYISGFDTFQNVTLKNNFFFSNNDISLLTAPISGQQSGPDGSWGSRGGTETYPFKVTQQLMIKLYHFKVNSISVFQCFSLSPFFPSLWVAAESKKNVCLRAAHSPLNSVGSLLSYFHQPGLDVPLSSP